MPPNLNRRSLAVVLFCLSWLFCGFGYAANVAWWSDDYSLSSMQSNLPPGNNYTQITVSDINAGALVAYDALIFGHVSSSNSITTTTCSQLQSFLSAGKGLVSEWNGATAIFPTAAGAYYPANMSCALFSGSAIGGEDNYGSNNAIAISNPASALVAGLANPFSMQDGSEYVYRITGYGAEWGVVGTSNLGGVNYPTVMAARYNNAGCVALSPFDYFDSVSLGGAEAKTLLGNMIGAVLGSQAGCDARAAAVSARPVPSQSATMLWLLSALVLMAATPALRRRLRR